MKKVIKILASIIILAAGLLLMSSNSEAASASMLANKTKVEVGDTIKVTVNINAAQWNLKLYANGSQIASSKELDNYESNISESFSGTYKATKSGTVKFTLEGDITDFDWTNTIIDESLNVTVSSGSSSSGGENSEGGNTSGGGSSNTGDDDEEETPSMSFTSVNQTVYATDDGINVRNSPVDGEVIGSLDKGDSVTRTGIGDGWSRIKYKGKTAYVSSSYITTTKPTSTEDEKKTEEDDKKNEDDNENKSNAKELSSLTVEQYKLEPDFNPDITEYSLTVGKDVEDLVIEAVAADENATVEITGNNGLLLGENTVNIKVTAEDGTVRTYKINVTKVEEIGIQLSELTVENYALSPEFSSDVYEYTLNIGDISVTSLNIIAKSNNENVNVEIAGNNNLKPGENIITILVSSDEGDTTTVYQIIVNIDEAFKNQVATTDNSNMYMYIGVGAAVVILLIIIIVVVRKRRKAAEEEFAPLNTYDLNFSSNNNVTNKDAVNETEKDIDTKEEKTRKKKKDKLEEEEYSLNSNGYDSNETPRKRGKHF